MANYVIVTLDTTGPTNPSISLDSGATFTSEQIINASIGTSDSVVTGYQMKVWGDVDEIFNQNIQENEADSSWITFQITQQIKLAAGDGQKTIYCKIRDDVYNESAQVSDTITLDTSLPAVTVSTPDCSKISKVPSKNQVSFTWQANEAFSEYKVMYVPGPSTTHDAGTQILSTSGSQNVDGNTGSYEENTNITTIITGADLEAAAPGDGAKCIKVFVKDLSGQWSA